MPNSPKKLIPGSAGITDQEMMSLIALLRRLYEGRPDTGE